MKRDDHQIVPVVHGIEGRAVDAVASPFVKPCGGVGEMIDVVEHEGERFWEGGGRDFGSLFFAAFPRVENGEVEDTAAHLIGIDLDEKFAGKSIDAGENLRAAEQLQNGKSGFAVGVIETVILDFEGFHVLPIEFDFTFYRADRFNFQADAQPFRRMVRG